MVEVAVAAVAFVALLLAAGDALRRRREERLARTVDLLLSLRVDDGLALLEQERQRSDVWWLAVEPLTRRQIDRALSHCDLVAALARSGGIEQRVVVEHVGTEILELWELAYPYVQHRHEQQPRLWESLADLYLDAYEAARETPAADTGSPMPTPEPERIEPAEPPAAAAVVPIDVPEPVDPHQLLIAALRDLPHPPPARVPSTTVTLELQSALAAPQAPPRTGAVFEEVVDLVPQPSTHRD